MWPPKVKTCPIQQYIEIRKDGKVCVDEPLIITDDGEFKQLEKIEKRYTSKGYKKIESSTSGSEGYMVLVDRVNEKAVYISYRLHFNTYDRYGYRIYKDSRLKRIYPDGYNVKFNIYHLHFYIDNDENHHVYLSELTGWDYGDGIYKDCPVENLDIFKDYEVV